MVLIDRATSWHCYADQGLLAVDCFTCGQRPDRIATHLHNRLIERMRGPACESSEWTLCFGDLSVSVRTFVDEHYRHFNAGTLGSAARSLNGFLEEGAKFLSPWPEP